MLGEAVVLALPAGPHGVEPPLVLEDGHVDGPGVVAGIADLAEGVVRPERVVGLEDVHPVVLVLAVAGGVVQVPPAADLVELGGPQLPAPLASPQRLPDHGLGVAVHPVEIGEPFDDDPPVVTGRLDQQEGAVVGNDERVLARERLPFPETVEDHGALPRGRRMRSLPRLRSQPVVSRIHTVRLAWAILMLSSSRM